VGLSKIFLKNFRALHCEKQEKDILFNLENWFMLASFDQESFVMIRTLLCCLFSADGKFRSKIGIS